MRSLASSTIHSGLNRSYDLALNRKRTTWDTRAGRCGVSPAAESSGDFVDVHLVAFGTQADAGQLRFDFLEHARHHHRRNCSDVIDQALRLAALGARTSEVPLFHPKIPNALVVG